MSNSSRRSLGKAVDWRLVLYWLVLVGIGWINIYASIHSSEPASIFDWSCRSGKQFVWILTATVLAAVILFAVNPRLWEVVSVPAYFAVVFLLVAVIFVGASVKGSHSWFRLGPVSFQPAEISKITTSLVLATIMGKVGFSFARRGDFLKVAAVVALPMLIIIAESETGSALVYVGFLFALFREGLSVWYLVLILAAIVLFILTLKAGIWVSLGVVAAGGIAGLVVLLRRHRPRSRERRSALRLLLLGVVAAGLMALSTRVVFDKVLADHQRSRIEVLLGMKEDPAGVGYNVRQSMIAIGSGGLFGKGYLQGTQTTYGFVPEQSTDFIFCTVGEEWGFVGCLAVILLYVALILRIAKDAERSREAFTRIYGYCLACCLFMHLFINIGMTIGLMPVIGIPLPFISYGGSSLWAFTVMLFIFIALDRQEKKYF
ncbi:MAG: rod shape-determining protein RodA [Bacteroidales bacterium]|nr:rod shape-determining protein RodA [Bacteroidales bacterium]